MKKPTVLITTTEYDVIKVGGLSAALTSMVRALKKYANPIIVLPRSGHRLPWTKVMEKRQRQATVEVYEHDGVSVYTLSNQILDSREVYPEPADTEGIRKIDEFSARLAEAVDDIDFDVVHMQDFFAYKAMEKFKDMGKPVLLTIHRLHREYPTWFYGEKIALQKADYITVVGESYYKEDEKEVFNKFKDKVVAVFNGIDSEFWNAAASSHPRLSRKERRKRILQSHGLSDAVLYVYVGRFDPVQKGVDVLFKAGEKLLKTESARMMIVGVGDKKLEQQSKELQQEYPSKLKVINQLLPMEKIRDLYASADFAVVPSIFEPFGLVQLEAMACECVPIGSRTGGIKDTVISYDDNPEKATGFLVEKGKWKDLLDAMKRAGALYIREPRVVENMRKNGRKRCEEIFQWDVSARKYFELYKMLLSAREAK